MNLENKNSKSSLSLYSFSLASEFLKQTLEEVKSTNPIYSMRSFARFLCISPAQLSSILENKKKLSIPLAIQIGQRLKLNCDELDYLCTLAVAEKIDDLEMRRRLLEKVSQEKNQVGFPSMKEQAFQVISEPNYMIALELLELPGENTIESIADLMNIDKTEVVNILTVLERENLIACKSGHFFKVNSSLHRESKTSNRALRDFHRKMLYKAIGSIEEQTTDEKYIGSLTLGFDQQQLEEAKKVFRQTIEKLRKIAEKQSLKTHVYHLGLQFFTCTKSRR